jgi:hypothetical protein
MAGSHNTAAYFDERAERARDLDDPKLELRRSPQRASPASDYGGLLPSRLQTSSKKNVWLFIDAMRHPVSRRIAFDVVERNCRARFAEDEDGHQLYAQLRNHVCESNSRSAVKEFEERFFPMLE